MKSKFIKPLSAFTFIIFTLIFQLSFTASAATKTIEDLESQGKLSITISVNENKQQIVGQALVLSIEVATDRWFSTGSRVQLLSLKDIVMQANNITTINGTKRIKNQTWATQIHEIVLYPTAYGDFKIPPINVDISINTENDGTVSGVLSTQALSFNIQLPEELKGIDNFIVSPEVTLTIDGQFDEEKDYAVGEAITQTITITASDTPAMMIKPINLVPHNVAIDPLKNNELEQKNKATLDRVSIYHKPARVFDKSNRGTLLGTRIESFTYIFERSGSYTINEEVIYWWNSQSNTLEKLLIPASTWTVSGSGLIKNGHNNSILTGLTLNAKTFFSFVILISLVGFAYFIFNKRQIISACYKKFTHYEQRQLRGRFLIHIANKEYIAAEQALFKYALFINKNVAVKQSPFAQKLNQLAFSSDAPKIPSTSLSVSETKQFLSKLDDTISHKIKSSHFFSGKVIIVDPGFETVG